MHSPTYNVFIQSAKESTKNFRLYVQVSSGYSPSVAEMMLGEMQ